MPKNNGQNVSYYGHTGHVENAVGETFELDPTRTLDGEDTEGLERGDDYPEVRPVDSPTSPYPSENTDGAAEREKAAETDGQADDARSDKDRNYADGDTSEGGEQSSVGASSKASSKSPVAKPSRTSTAKTSTAPETANRSE